jgi:hypothetical protein
VIASFSFHIDWKGTDENTSVTAVGTFFRNVFSVLTHMLWDCLPIIGHSSRTNTV